MNVAIGCVCWGFFSLSAYSQSAGIPYAADFIPTGPGNQLLVKPVAGFFSPAVLGDAGVKTNISITNSRFIGLPVTGRTEGAGTMSIHKKSAIGLKMAVSGKGHYRMNEYGVAYGRQLAGSKNETAKWLMGVLFHIRQQKTGEVKPTAEWHAGLSLMRSGTHTSYSMLLLKGADKISAWQLNVHASQSWSAQLATEISGTYMSGSFSQTAISIQYHFLSNAYLIGQCQLLPSRLYWEQGYKLRSFWLSIFVMRYQLIGWKSGVGIIWNTGKHKKEDE